MGHKMYFDAVNHALCKFERLEDTEKPQETLGWPFKLGLVNR